jgi:hypothetical protein
MLLAAGTQNLRSLLSTEKGAKAVAKWFIKTGVLEQFKISREEIT